MRLNISLDENKLAIVSWLKDTYNIKVSLDDIQPLEKTEGEYEDARTYQNGWYIELNDDNFPKFE